MTEGCCKRFKQIEASIVRYKKPDGGKCKKSCEAAQETKQFEGRVNNLKSKLNEANTNIAMLRAFVSQADIDIDKEQKPQTPKKPKCEKLKDTIDELKELIVKLNEHQHQAKVVTDRCLVAVNVFDEVENQKCFCALVTESCEKIKKELAEILAVKEELDETINQLKNPTDEAACAPPVTDMLEEVKTSIQEIKACGILSCPKLKNSGIQSASATPSKLPRLVQPNGKCCPQPCATPPRGTRSKGCGC